ncbi:MAG: acyl-CoA reductase [Chitinophagales bacterium]
MNIEQRVHVLTQLQTRLQKYPISLNKAILKAHIENQWFSTDTIKQSLDAICTHFLAKEKLETWMARYDFVEPAVPKKVGLVMAGNIPLVGFHDFLCVFMSGHYAQIKLSNKDKRLFTAIAGMLIDIAPEMAKYIEMVPILKNFDAVIATGSNNTGRYFESYFGKYPNIIRKNRSSIAILNGKETAEDLIELGKDVFQYYGMGCRNVSKLMIPRDFDLVFLLDQWETYKELMHHNKYKNNYDYQRAILLINKVKHLASDHVMILEEQKIAAPISIVYYEYYDDEDALNNLLVEKHKQIQCVVGQGEDYIPFGKAQSPQLWDYADKMDTMQFLLSL